MGATVGAGTDVGLVDGTDVGAVGTEVGAAVVAAAVVGRGVAVAEEPQAKIAASKRANAPKIIAFGFLNQWFKTDHPPM